MKKKPKKKAKSEAKPGGRNGAGELDPEAVADEVEGLVAESMSLWEAGKLEQALEAAELACELDAGSSAAHHCRAAALLDLERVEEAIEACEAGLEAAPDDPEALLYGADFYLGVAEGDPDAIEISLKLTRRGLKHARAAQDDELEAELLLLEGSAFEQRGDLADALASVEKAVAILGEDDPAAGLERGLLLFELCRFDQAEAQLGRLERAEDEGIAAAAHHHLGLLEERRGRVEAAAKRFARARKLAPEDYPEPVRLSSEAFDGAVEAALQTLPAKIRDYLQNVAITVEEIPADADLLGEPPLSPLILGVFRGSPLGQKSGVDPWAQFPSSIVLYQKNLERFARSREELIEQIGITLMHEVGHFLGLDEDELWERGLA